MSVDFGAHPFEKFADIFGAVVQQIIGALVERPSEIFRHVGCGPARVLFRHDAPRDLRSAQDMVSPGTTA